MVTLIFLKFCITEYTEGFGESTHTHTTNASASPLRRRRALAWAVRSASARCVSDVAAGRVPRGLRQGQGGQRAPPGTARHREVPPGTARHRTTNGRGARSRLDPAAGEEGDTNTATSASSPTPPNPRALCFCLRRADADATRRPGGAQPEATGGRSGLDRGVNGRAAASAPRLLHLEPVVLVNSGRVTPPDRSRPCPTSGCFSLPA